MLRPDEFSEVLPLKVFKVMQSKFYTLFILEGPQKRIPIYTEPQVGLKIQDILSSQANSRPKTFDLLQLILQGLDAKPLKAIIYDVDNNVYKSHLFLEQKQDNKEIILKIDSRPSDCLTLALMSDLPLFCYKEAFKKAPSFDLQ
jgi:bifunctional DNase/RNase